MWLVMQISSFKTEIYFIKYYIKLIKYVQKVPFIFIFLNFGLNDWSIGAGDTMELFTSKGTV